MKNFQFSIFNFQKDLPRSKRSFASGFTLIEVLMALVIVGLVSGIVAFSFSKLNSEQALDTSAVLAVSVLNEARSLTLASVNGERYGVKIDDSQFVIVPTYATTTLNSLVGVRNVNLSGGGTTIYFERLSGRTNQSGTFEVYLKNASTTYKTVSINSNGLAQ